MLSIEHLYKYYDDFCAVNDLNLNIGENELFGFVGPNGAGKTTTMKILAGLIAPSKGNVTLNGVDLSKNPYGMRELIGYMPDFFGVYDNLKVQEYMEFFASIYGITGQKFLSVSERLLRLVHLEDRKNQYVDELSRGLKQKLCLARCLIHDPQLLILDEPASGLDPGARIEVKDILHELHEQGKTIIISSHILSELAQMCTHLGIIKNGHMLVNDEVSNILGLENESRTLIITVCMYPEKAVAIIRDNENVEKLSYINNEIRVSFTGTDFEAAELLKQLIAQDIAVKEYRRENSTLESLFLELTGQESEDTHEN